VRKEIYLPSVKNGSGWDFAFPRRARPGESKRREFGDAFPVLKAEAQTLAFTVPGRTLFEKILAIYWRWLE
jgi:hypothetical protein